MFNFEFYAPTRVIFGKETETRAGELVKEYGGTRVLVHFGGKSAEKSGLLDRVKASLDAAGIFHVELGGVVPNPHIGKVYEGIELAKANNVDFILAVGGGSVIDSSKAIAYGMTEPDKDVWELYAHERQAKGCLPIGVILTIAAAGSEMSNSSVITNEKTGTKRDYGNNMGRPKFAIMNPELTTTLPDYQTESGCTDIMMHTMERYFSREDDMDLTDGIAEALLRSMKENVFKVLADPQDYRARAQIMWGGSLSHNGLTECGLVRDWSCHKLEHELSGVFDVTHGAGLAAIWPAWARYVYAKHIGRFAQFAVNVMGVQPDASDPAVTAAEGIRAFERFLREIGMPVNLHELLGREVTEAEIDDLAGRCSRGGTFTIGTLESLARSDMAAIYRLAR